MLHNNNRNICNHLKYRTVYGTGIHANNHINYEIIQRCFEVQTWNKVGNSLVKFLSYSPTKTKDNFFVDLELNVYALHSTLETHGADQEKLAIVIISLNLIESFCDILVTKLNPESNGKEIKHILEIICICLNLVPKYSVCHLRQNQGLMEMLFSFFITKNKTLFNAGSKIIVEIFDGDANFKPFILSSVKGLRKVMQEVNGCSQTAFYQVLLAIISEAQHFSDIPFTLLKQDQRLSNIHRAISVSNHEFILSTEGFLEKVFTISTRELKDIPQIEHRERLALMFAPLPNVIETAGESMFSGITRIISDIVIAADRGMKETVCFILTFLFAGKCRKQVQERFVKCNMVQRFYNIFQPIIWNQNVLVYETNGDLYQSDYLQVQFLRLIHAIFDNSQDRILFLSKNELQTLRKETGNCGIREPFPSNINDSFLVDEPKGLTSLIVDNLKLETKTSFVRFWIMRCLESFLKCSSPFFQHFLLQKNLLEECLNLLISGGLENSCVKQGIFDFLSMLIIKNINAFVRSETVLDCTATFNILVCDMQSDLIDSNTFIRSIILTVHHIKSTKSLEDYKNILLRSKLLQHFSSRNKIIEIVASSLNLLTLPTISQGNICCLNTCILIMLLGHQNNEMPNYLNKLSKLHSGVAFLKNLRTLLQFWIKHYSLPFTKSDCNSLEESSGIAFEQWKLVVTLLLSFDSKLETSILHYTEERNELLDINIYVHK